MDHLHYLTLLHQLSIPKISSCNCYTTPLNQHFAPENWWVSNFSSSPFPKGSPIFSDAPASFCIFASEKAPRFKPQSERMVH